jgi:glycosyltransferase involved in cell wall biosynthesis
LDRDDCPGAAPLLSVAVPLYNESESVRPLVAAVRDAMSEWPHTWELVLVDDGSRDDTVAIAASETRDDARVRLVRLARNYGQATAMQAGFDHARGTVIVSMDGDLQNDPHDIPRLVAKLDEGFDMVAGYRVRRQDRFLSRKVPSYVANRIIRWLTDVPIRDNGCSLKAYRREVIERIRLYSDMHRFIPVLAVSLAGARIAEIPVRHHPRRWGSSKYGLSRATKVLADLLTITMIRSFRERPLRLYGAAAAVVMLVALVPLFMFLSAALDPVRSAHVGVLASVTLILVGLSGFLGMVGIVAETALVSQYDGESDGPILRPLA